MKTARIVKTTLTLNRVRSKSSKFVLKAFNLILVRSKSFQLVLELVLKHSGGSEIALETFRSF